VRVFKPLVLVVFSLLLSGCSLLSLDWFGSDDIERSRMERLVADDFAEVLAQLKPTDPNIGPLSMSRPESAFGNSLMVALRSSGFSLIFTDDPGADAFVRYNVESLENQFGASLGYRVSANEVTLSRDYKMKASGVFPISFMRIEGAVSDSVSLDDARFKRQNVDEVVISGITPDETLTTPIASEDATAETVVAGGAAGEAPVKMIIDDDGGEVIDKNNVARLNMYNTRRSNYAEYLGKLSSVERTVLVFPNDSLRVLPESRATLRDMHDKYNPQTDVFSVIGCSHGNTALNNGNELLAIGRSKRVLEELISLGVSDEKVLDEGCWAGVHFDGAMPRRGVVVELKRQQTVSP